MSRDIALLFEYKYQQWKLYCLNSDILEQSSDQAYIANAQFQEIVELGEEVIPHIILKMKEELDAHFLIHALEQITKKKFSSEEVKIARKKYGFPLGNQGYAAMWQDWWNEQHLTR